jgi:hypothetical protein
MKKTRTYLNVVIWLMLLVLTMPLEALSQSGNGGTQAPAFKKEELTQMLAPIALYPDSLLSQILMASTYPLEIVEADRWVKQNPGLTGDKLDKALQEKSWDPSVKSLCHYNTVLARMSDQIDQTSKLGDAFLAQQKDVMDTVQELRQKAYAQGNLKSGKEQNVVVEKETQTIIIQPADPQVVYVPTYSPTVVYGAWWYPAYPPYVWYPPPPPYYGAVAFGAGFAVGIAVASWSSCNWNNHNVYVNVNQTNVFNKNTNINNIHNNTWNHDPSHRQGLAYHDSATAQKYGQNPSLSQDARRQSRGYDGKGSSGMGAKGQGSTPAWGGGHKEAGNTAFSGYGSGKQEKTASDRGVSSRGSSFGEGGSHGFGEGSSHGGGGFFHGSGGFHGGRR